VLEYDQAVPGGKSGGRSATRAISSRGAQAWRRPCGDAYSVCSTGAALWGTPLVWLSSWRMLTWSLYGRIPGSRLSRVSERASRPSATNRRITVATSDLVTLPARKRRSGRIGWPVSRLARPLAA